MTEDERMQRGKEMARKCYGDVLPMPEDVAPESFQGLTFRNLFNDIWGRDGMSFRDRRLVVLGALAGLGADTSLFEIHIKSALRNGEITADELREVILITLPYVGYPRTSPLYMMAEKVIAAEAERAA